MELTDDRNGLKLQKSKRFCAIKGDNVIPSIGTSLQTLGAPNTPLWIVHSDPIATALYTTEVARARRHTTGAL